MEVDEGKTQLKKKFGAAPVIEEEEHEAADALGSAGRGWGM